MGAKKKKKKKKLFPDSVLEFLILTKHMCAPKLALQAFNINDEPFNSLKGFKLILLTERIS